MNRGRALYIEIDPYCREWLANLIAAGLICPGDVVSDIRDVRPSDLDGYSQVHAFAGIGIWSAALRNAGIPDDANVWTGSCPCQPFSQAGQRGGFDDERHLWPAFHWLIEQCRPAIVLGEQVASPDGLRWLDLVQDDLEGSGYAFGAADTCAAGAGVAFAESDEGQATLEWIRGTVLDCPDPFLAAELRDFAAWAGTELGVGAANIRQRLYWVGVADSAGWIAREPAAQAMGHGRAVVAASSASARRDPAGELAHSDGGQSEQSSGERSGPGEALGGRPYGQPDGRSKLAQEQPAASPTNGFWRDADWLYCRDGKWRPVEPGTFPLAHGAPGRVGRLRAYGNAINKAQAEIFIHAAIEARTDQ